MPSFFLRLPPFFASNVFFFFFQYPAVWLDVVLGQVLPEQSTSQASGRTSASTDKCPIFFLPSGRVEMLSLQSQGIKQGAGPWQLASSLALGLHCLYGLLLSDSLLPD